MSNLDKAEYYLIVDKILENPEFQRRKTFEHHGTITVYDHSLAVSKLAYKLAKLTKQDYKAAAISGLLHDFYYKPWQVKKEKNKTNKEEKKKFLEKHGFVHAREAMENSKKYFPEYMDKKVENAILRHMFPLNKIPPKYIVGWIVTIADKCVSCEVILHPSFFKYLMFNKSRK